MRFNSVKQLLCKFLTKKEKKTLFRRQKIYISFLFIKTGLSYIATIEKKPKEIKIPVLKGLFLKNKLYNGLDPFLVQIANIDFLKYNGIVTKVLNSILSTYEHCTIGKTFLKLEHIQEKLELKLHKCLCVYI